MFRSLAAVLVASQLLLSGCAWQRIPAAPEYAVAAPLPIKLGVVLADNPTTAYYGPRVINFWKDKKTFEGLIYPYREGDVVDGVLTLAFTGGWKGQGAGAGFLVGLTLGLASAAVGPSMTGTHEAVSVIKKGETELARYAVNVESTVTWGMGADTNEVTRRADELQGQKIAVELARKIEADRMNVLRALGK